MSSSRTEWDALRVSQALLMIISVSRVHQAVAFIGLLRPGLVLIAVALGSALLNPRGLAGSRWLSRWSTLLVIGLTACTLGSIAFGISQGGAWYYFSQNYSKVLVAALLLAATLRKPRDLYVFVWAYVIGSAVLVWMALFLFRVETTENGVARLGDMLTWDANDMGVLLLIALPFSLLAYRTSGRNGRIAAVAVMLGIGAAIARSGSRGAFLGCGAVIAGLLFSLKGTSVGKRLIFAAGVLIAIAVAAPSGYWRQMNTITSVDQDYNWDAAQGRRQLATRGLQYMMSYPAFGVGLQNFGRAEGTISDLARNWDPSRGGLKWSAPHNSYIEAGAELGIPGFILYCGLVLGCVLAPFRLRQRILPEWARGTWEQRFLFQAAMYLPLAAVGYAVSSFFVSFAYNDPLYILAAITGALPECVQAELDRARISPPAGRVVPQPPIQWVTAPVPRRTTLPPTRGILPAGARRVD